MEIAVKTFRFGGNSTMDVISVEEISSSSRLGGKAPKFTTPAIALEERLRTRSEFGHQVTSLRSVIEFLERFRVWMEFGQTCRSPSATRRFPSRFRTFVVSGISSSHRIPMEFQEASMFS